MSLTFGEAKTYLAQYAGKGGKCPSSEQTSLFVKTVLQYLLYSGQNGNLRKFCFHAIRGCVTFPYELEVPLKFKVDNEVGDVWDKWFEWYPQTDMDACVPCGNAMFEEPNTYPIVNDLPSSGSRVGIVAICEEEEGAHAIIQGYDEHNREVVTYHKGEQIKGEYLSLQKGQLKITTTVFSKVTHVIKTKTKGYSQLYWVNLNSNRKGFLAEYSPLETIPSYRRFRIKTDCPNLCKVSILGKIRIKQEYADLDVIPFDNLYALQLAAQAINADYNENVDIARAKDQSLQVLIERENAYKRVQTGSTIAVSPVTSAGRIRNLVRGWGRRY